jgi:M6 family metalloprotease-like protein
MNRSLFYFLSLFSLLFININSTHAAYLKDIPRVLIQPNGDTLHCYVTGDEYYNYLHDVNHFTIVQNVATGYFVYAMRENEAIVPSMYIAGTVNPAEVGLKPGIIISPEQWSAKRTAFNTQIPPKNSQSITEQNQGHLNNLVVFIRFASDLNLTTGYTTVHNMFNDSSFSAVSMYNYFKSTSYNQLFVTSSFYPAPSGNTILSYQDIYERSYYLPYSATNTNGYNGDSERTSREHGLLQRATNYIASSVPTSLNIDYDSDGYVDNVCFVIKGEVGDWSDLLWPHRWVLYSENVYINSKRVYDYNFMLEGSTGYFATHVLCHEMQHTLTFPDLYHYSDNTINAVGSWDLMCSTSNPPQNSVAYAKMKYGNWISSIPTITTPGVYTLNPLATSPTGNAYKMASEVPGQFYVIEYRKTDSQFDSSLPGSGILIYRVNENFDGNAGYNGTTVFDEIYIFRPNGTNTVNGNVSNAFYNSTVGRTAFNSTTNPRPFLTDGTYSSLSITNITNAGTTISFTYNGLQPSIIPSISTLDFSGYVPTGAIPQSVSVSGLFLTDSITVTATSPFLVSKNNSAWFSTLKLPSNGGLLYIKYNSQVMGSHTGTVTLTSGTAQSVVLNLTGIICDVVNSFPFTEGFEGGALPSCWSQTFVSGQVDWVFQNGGHNGGSGTNHPASAHTGSKNALMFYDSSSGYTTKMITPALNLSAISNPQLTFWMANPIWGGDIDDLKVYYKTTASGNWILLNSYTTNAENWTQKTISLPNASSTYFIAFEGVANYGYGVSLDDITITGTMVNHQITASAGMHGSISPNGIVTVPNGANQTFNFTPNANYMVDSVFVDNSYVGRFNSYTFTNVTTNHTINVKFKLPNTNILLDPENMNFQTIIGTVSFSQTALITGVDLIGTISVSAPENFEVSINNNVWENSLLFDATVPNTIFVRFNPLSIGTFTDSISINSGTIHKKITVNGVASDLMFTILSMSNAGGTINPEGSVLVENGNDQTFLITPDPNFILSALYIDEEIVPNTNSYTFTSVDNGHIIYAYFVDPTKVDELNTNEDLFMYPNPVISEFTVAIVNPNFTIQQVQIYDVTGKLLISSPIESTSTHFNMTPYSQGIYFVKITINNQTITKKILKL